MFTIQNLTAGYQGKAVAEIQSLTLNKGQHCLILGKSGSGKTTLLYALAGLLTPLSGSVTLDDTEITRLDKQALDHFRGKHIGIIYQTLHMVGALSVLDNMLLAQYSAGITQDRNKAEQLLKQLSLSDISHQKPSSLSQGQQQRVAIARAAMNSPRLLLGDEPTSALDDDSCKTVMELLLHIAETSGANLLIATHDSRIASYFHKAIILGEHA